MGENIARTAPVQPAQGATSGVALPRLAVCPYCRNVWELEPFFQEPVKLMICWRCAEKAGARPPGLANTDVETPYRLPPPMPQGGIIGLFPEPGGSR